MQASSAAPRFSASANVRGSTAQLRIIASATRPPACVRFASKCSAWRDAHRRFLLPGSRRDSLDMRTIQVRAHAAPGPHATECNRAPRAAPPFRPVTIQLHGDRHHKRARPAASPGHPQLAETYRAEDQSGCASRRAMRAGPCRPCRTLAERKAAPDRVGVAARRHRRRLADIAKRGQAGQRLQHEFRGRLCPCRGRHFDRFAGWRGHTMDHNAAAGRQVSRWVHLAPNRSKASGSDQPGKPMLNRAGLPRGRLDRRDFGPFRRLFARQGSCTCNTPTPCPANGTTTIPLAHRLAGTWLGADRGRTLRRRDSGAGWCFPVRCGRHAVDPQFNLGEALLRPDQAALAALRPCRRQGDAAQQESRQGD